MIGVILALISAIVSAFAVVLVARHAKESTPLYISIVITVTGLIVMLPFGLMLTDFSAINLESILLFAASGILAPGLTRLFYYRGLRRLGTSVNSSVFSFYPIYGVFLATLFLNEVLTVTKLAGIGAIVSGIVIIQMSCKDHACANSSLREWSIPILGGITFAASAILSKFALMLLDAPYLGVTISFGFALIPYIVILYLNSNARGNFLIRKNLNLFWLAGIALAAAGLLAFLALSYSTVNVVIPLRSTESLFIVFFAFFYLRQEEHLSKTMISGILLTIVGVLLVII